MERALPSIDGLVPLRVEAPQSVEELGEIVRRAAASGQAVYPVGGGTMLEFGLPPSKPGSAVDLRRLDQVIDYPARDLTITVQAGITMARLQEVLRQENQQLPIDVPLPQKATLGGALATNACGPRRFGYGTLRDYVIGISVVNDEGQEVKAGGRVVKNVAGYDMCKLYVGALGTLGIITQVTLKVRPLAECTAWLAIGCSPTVVLQLPELLQGARTRPVCLDLLNAPLVGRLTPPDFLPSSAWVFVVGFEGQTKTVAWQIDEMRRALRSTVDHGDATLHDLSLAMPQFALGVNPLFSFKGNLLSSSTAKFCRKIAADSDDVLLHAHAGNGIVTGHIIGEARLARVQLLLERIHEETSSAQGNFIVLRCPTEWKKSLPIWGVPRGDRWLMRAIKDKLDPRRIFNPGRFVDGI